MQHTWTGKTDGSMQVCAYLRHSLILKVSLKRVDWMEGADGGMLDEFGLENIHFWK